MSFFRPSNSGNPPSGYARMSGEGRDSRDSLLRERERDREYSRRLPPASQYHPPPSGYNDPSSSLFEKGGYMRRQQPPPPPPGRAASFGVVGSPSDALALTNCLTVHPADFPEGVHALVNGAFPITLKHDNVAKLQPGTVGASKFQRQWIGLSMTGDHASVELLPPPPHPSAPGYVQAIDVEVGFIRHGFEISEVFSADDMAKSFLKAFSGVVMTQDEPIVFEYHGHNLKGTVRSVVLLDVPGNPPPIMKNTGIITSETDVTIMKAGDSAIKIKSSAKKAPPNAILAPNFKFEDMGIGGLDSEFSDIFRRAFASRVFPPALVEKLGIQHVKGLILHGPPGTGKTLIARQIGKMLNAREPKIVNGPEVLSKFVGASEENIRKLFADAEKEYKEKGDDSGLHIIIFDELDAIFKQRGSTNSGTGVGDTVVNQLLSKMDGVDQLNNILVIGMTNRLDMIDEALLRPGRLEVHMEISLPDEKGRFQILNIHTNKMRDNGVMDDDVDLFELAALTKNFSGAEITGLVKSATSFAFSRHVKVGTMAGISEDVENLRVNRQDFIRALDEVHPAFGVSEEELVQVVQNGIIHHDPVIDKILQAGKLLVEQVRTSSRTPLVSVLLYGPPGSGKTALGASIAQASGFPFIKLLSPDSMVGYSEAQKVAAITRVFNDSYKSPLSVVVVDNIERLIDWTPMGARFSNAVLQTLLVLFSRRPPKDRRLLIIATSSLRSILTDLGFSENFDSELHVPPISSVRSLDFVLQEVELFQTDHRRNQAIDMLEAAGYGGDDPMSPAFQIGIKKLLSVIEMARQEPENVAERLASSLLELRGT